MSSNRRASLSRNSPLDQLFAPSRERDEHELEVAREREEGAREEHEAQARALETKPQSPELRQTTIMIYPEQSDWLDEACYRARRDGGSIISKAAIIRALVDMAREEEDVRARLRERLGIR